MLRSNKNGKYAHSLLAVHCGKKRTTGTANELAYTRIRESLTSACEPGGASGSAKISSDFVTAGQLEVHVLETPSKAELKQRLEVIEPDVIYFVGECTDGTEEVGPLELADGLVSVEDIATLFNEKLPELVCLETCAASKFGDALRNKGVSIVMYWKGLVTRLWAAQFRQALLAILRSFSGQIWHACQLAKSAFQFQRGIAKAHVLSMNVPKGSNIIPVILGSAPSKMPETPKTKQSAEFDTSPSTPLKVQIYDEDVDVPLLIVAETHGQDYSIFGFLEDGLDALLMMEVMGMRLLHRVSGPPQPSSAPPLARGVITMRCDLCTSASTRISLHVAGTPQTCFDDQVLEYSIKKELLEQNKILTCLTGALEKPVADMRRSAAVACGAHVMEVRFRSPSWAVQILRQLARDISYRSLVSLGIAGVQGLPVTAFLKEDTDRFYALRSSSLQKGAERETENHHNGSFSVQFPSWFSLPLPSRKRQQIDSFMSAEKKPYLDEVTSCPDAGKDVTPAEVLKLNSASGCNSVAPMKPVPHSRLNRDMPSVGAALAGAQNTWTTKANLNNSTAVRLSRPNATSLSHTPTNTGPPATHRGQTAKAPSPAQITSLNATSIKKHGCNRRPLHECSDEEFRKDLMQFLSSRGHGRLVPSEDVATFPDAVLNGRKLDLYNLYKEVVSRGGFHVGNGINWKGQVFPKMHNHTVVNRMTGVSNTLKRHYETFLLEYELAHDDVDGECCLLCHSSAAGDWVNCGLCGEWAHYGCDKRHGLGAFKEYAKTDGLEYVCPRCSATNGRNPGGRRRSKASANGFSCSSEGFPQMAPA
ncbi:hypothetical protein KP509_26G036800 [Ceratopteris richardii]|uniref:ARID domain-containing protein n=1 Tax=Ceratopteris richardii TaxID=49495 RepID=A0A8T2RLN7_CERRI|nr:hypothetical protein KP509_26G036800 [Ceratopteris richardii]